MKYATKVYNCIFVKINFLGDESRSEIHTHDDIKSIKGVN